MSYVQTTKENSFIWGCAMLLQLLVCKCSSVFFLGITNIIIMAMEKQYVITDTHSQAITAIGFHPLRREIFVGFEGKNKMLDNLSMLKILHLLLFFLCNFRL